MPPIASFAVFVAVIGLTEAVEGDTHGTHRDLPANLARCYPSVPPTATTPDPHIRSLPQGGTYRFTPVFTHDLGVVVCSIQPLLPYTPKPPRRDAAWYTWLHQKGFCQGVGTTARRKAQ